LKLLNVLDSLIENIISISFAILVLVLFAEVVSRYFLNFPIMWAGELGRYLFIWIVYLGASIAITKKKHIIVGFVVEKLPPQIRYYLELIIHFFMIIFFFFIFYYGIQYAWRYMDYPAFSLKQIRMGWVYLAAPVGMFLMIVNLFRNLPKKFTKKKGDKFQ